MLEQAIAAMTDALGEMSVGDSEEWRRKANIIGDFATAVSDAVLARAGIEKEGGDSPWNFNRLVGHMAGYPDEEGPPGCLYIALDLNNVPAGLDAIGFPRQTCLVFCEGNVVEWSERGDHNRAIRSMSYEEAARYVVLWLAEKLIQIIRRNRWDRVSTLPTLWDRLAVLAADLREPRQRTYRLVFHNVGPDGDDDIKNVLEAELGQPAQIVDWHVEHEVNYKDHVPGGSVPMPQRERIVLVTYVEL